jgi:AcrR family transcriptional regulator
MFALHTFKTRNVALSKEIIDHMPQRQSYHHGNLRIAILSRAAEVIKNGGIETLSLRALAKDLNVSATAPARHFSGKIDILRTLAKDGYDQATIATLAAMSREPNNPVLRVRAMMLAFLEWSSQNPANFATILHPEVARHADKDLVDALNQFRDAICLALDDAQKAGWQSNQSPDHIYHLMMGTIRGVTQNLSDPLYRTVFGAFDADQAANVIDILFQGFLDPAPDE